MFLVIIDKFATIVACLSLSPCTAATGCPKIVVVIMSSLKLLSKISIFTNFDNLCCKCQCVIRYNDSNSTEFSLLGSSLLWLSNVS